MTTATIGQSAARYLTDAMDSVEAKLRSTHGDDRTDVVDRAFAVVILLQERMKKLQSASPTWEGWNSIDTQLKEVTQKLVLHKLPSFTDAKDSILEIAYDICASLEEEQIDDIDEGDE